MEKYCNIFCPAGRKDQQDNGDHMALPQTFSELKDVFINAELPDLSEFEGEYLVDMLTLFPSFKRFSHRKIFCRGNGITEGYNVLFGKQWGHFFIEEDICKDPDQKRAAVINYNRKDNFPLIRGIRDHVRCVEKPRLYIGRFNYRVAGNLIFLGYFSLEKIK